MGSREDHVIVDDIEEVSKISQYFIYKICGYQK